MKNTYLVYIDSGFSLSKKVRDELVKDLTEELRHAEQYDGVVVFPPCVEKVDIIKQ
jgi:hypothetical protein